MNPGMSLCFTVISPAIASFAITSPCSGYFRVRLQPTEAVSNSRIDVSKSWDFGCAIYPQVFTLNFQANQSANRQKLCSIMEPEPHLDKDFPRFIPVEASKCLPVLKSVATLTSPHTTQQLATVPHHTQS